MSPLSPEKIEAIIAKSGCAGDPHWEGVLRGVLQRRHLQPKSEPTPPHWHKWLDRYLDAAPQGRFADEARAVRRTA